MDIHMLLPSRGTTHCLCQTIRAFAQPLGVASCFVNFLEQQQAYNFPHHQALAQPTYGGEARCTVLF